MHKETARAKNRLVPSDFPREAHKPGKSPWERGWLEQYQSARGQSDQEIISLVPMIYSQGGKGS